MPNGKDYKASRPLNFLLIHGPALGFLGMRDPEIYGTETLEDIEGWVITHAQDFGVNVNTYQSESEGDILKFLMKHRDDADGIIINPGAYSHYSYAIMEMLRCMPCPIVEVHLSNLNKREEFRHKCVTACSADGVIMGLGKHGYYGALIYLIEKLREEDEL